MNARGVLVGPIHPPKHRSSISHGTPAEASTGATGQ
jgi:hypothetical protein